MEDFSAPSFSLGLDLDIADLSTEGEEDEEEADHHSLQPCPFHGQSEEDNLGETSIQRSESIVGQETLDEAEVENPPKQALKRLRRGPPPPPLVAAGASRPSVDGHDLTQDSSPSANLYDEIEEFSSPEKELKRGTDDCPSTQSNVACSNTKFSLLRRGFVRDTSEVKKIASKSAPASFNASTLTRLDMSNEKVIFPRLTISPIRKINLIDSDSDDSSDRKGKHRKDEEIDTFSRKGKNFYEKCSPKSSLPSKLQDGSSWKNFSPMKNSKFETPALDEFCKEYFQPTMNQKAIKEKGEMNSFGFYNSRGLDSVKCPDVNFRNNINGKENINWDSSSPQPPAYKYFLHTDPRIQALVRQRLPHFIPLGAKNNTETGKFGAENMDYMNQFNPSSSHGKTSIAPENLTRSKSSKKQNKENHYNVMEASNTTRGWVNPRNRATVPKDAGKRRVSADVHRSGQWYTDQNGRKVYVSKDGEKSSGQAAYRKYKKEIGGFRRTKKKGSIKKSRS